MNTIAEGRVDQVTTMRSTTTIFLEALCNSTVSAVNHAQALYTENIRERERVCVW
jgi:hypothetical protein